MRILMIGPTPRIYGGISAVAGAILDSDLVRQHQVTYLAEGTRQGRLNKLKRFASALLQVSWRLLRSQADVMHLHVGDGGSFYRHVLYLALGRLAGVPVVFHWHLPGDASAATSFYQSGGATRRWLVRWALDNASRVVVLSNSWQPALARLAPNSLDLAGRIAALPNPVNCQEIRPLGSCQPGGEVGNSLNKQSLVLFLGDFSARKGVRDLLAAAPTILAAHPAARFALCGGEPPADVQDLAAPLAGACRFPGFVRGAEKLRLLQEATLLALPSYAEGVPVAVLEAMAAGLPVVTTPVGGLPDILQDGRNGLFAPVGDVPALAAAICRLLADPALARRMGQANRQQALAEYDLPAYTQKLSALYADL